MDTSCEHRSEAGRDVDDACGGAARGTAAGSPPGHTQTGTSAAVKYISGVSTLKSLTELDSPVVTRFYINEKNF